WLPAARPVLRALPMFRACKAQQETANCRGCLTGTTGFGIIALILAPPLFTNITYPNSHRPSSPRRHTAMPHQVACPECHTTFMLPESAQGKIVKVRCKQCSHIFTVGNGAAATMKMAKAGPPPLTGSHATVKGTGAHRPPPAP